MLLVIGWELPSTTLAGPFAVLILLVRLELEVVTTVFICLDVQSLFTALSQFAVEDLVLAELAFQGTVEQGVFRRWTETNPVEEFLMMRDDPCIVAHEIALQVLADGLV